MDRWRPTLARVLLTPLFPLALLYPVSSLLFQIGQRGSLRTALLVESESRIESASGETQEETSEEH